MDVVVVESPAKAKTINKFLGDGVRVIASYGHVRDLPPKDGSVRPDDGFAMDWSIEARAQKHINEIADAVRKADRLYLATDPDREGEAISWHVCQVLNERRVLDKLDVKRVVFNEITKDAIVEAFARPRDLDQELVDAYLARRALDYLVGFTLSPVLWRKLPGSRSAGRVQSVALRLICERETEIETFQSQEYWSVDGHFFTTADKPVVARLTHLNGQKLGKFDLPDEAAAMAAKATAEGGRYAVAEVERKQVKRNPAPPFITSTLQQEASRKLGFAASRTMQLAQRLYEGVAIGGETVGLITYMRTDGVQMAADAVQACRTVIGESMGARYLPEKPRLYKTRAKNAQEAHEAIRPTDIARRPDAIARHLEPDQLKLYTLIWRRTLASQMASALIDQVAADIANADKSVVFRATGSTVAFDGFLKVYREGTDDPERDPSDTKAGQRGQADGDDGGRILPELTAGEAASLKEVVPEQHFTQPPPRYTEASLVKKLEELGIGRPSTYASIIAVLQDREYVRLDNKRFLPEDRGRLVTAFLTSFFERYVAYGFTADMETRLDDVSGGRLDWRELLKDFWTDFNSAVDETRDLTITNVLEALNRLLASHFFPEPAEGGDARACPACSDGRLSLKLGRFGAFIGCSNYPECRYTRPLVRGDKEGAPAADTANGQGRLLGSDPSSGLPVTLRTGPYGLYVQLGEETEQIVETGKTKKKLTTKKIKPKRASLSADMDPDILTLDQGLALLALPRTIGTHPTSGEEMVAGIGRYGPYIKMGETWVSLKGDDDVLTIGANRAVTLIDEARAKKPPGRALGNHPDDGKPIQLKRGRFGPYVEHNGVRATLPKTDTADSIELDRAIEILTAKISRSGNGGSKKADANKKSGGRNRTGAAAKPTATNAAAAADEGTKKPRKARTAATGRGSKARKEPAATSANDDPSTVKQ